jgi:arylsulfatase A-like enzyme
MDAEPYDGVSIRRATVQRPAGGIDQDAQPFGDAKTPVARNQGSRAMRSAMGLIAAVLAITSVGQTSAAASPPNVLFLLTDDQRADTIAALGNDHIHTPNLDRLVREGFAFRNAYCMGGTQPAVCMPSRTMIHSGMSLFRLEGVEQRPQLPVTFREAGYETWLLSKNGNTPHNLHNAFEHEAYLKDQEERAGGYSGRTEADAAIAFLTGRLQSNAELRRPFCMYVGFAGPHDPRGTNDEFRALYDVDEMSLPANYLPYHPFDNGEMLVRDEKLEAWPRTEEAVRRHLFDYYAMISHMDFQIGRIFAVLEQLGEWDNTIIAFSSDHGLAIGSHGLFGKQNLYEDGMKAPLIFRGPGVPHGESESLAYLFDIYPTLCELSGVEVPAGLDGRSLAPVMRGEVESVRDSVFLAYRDVQRAVRYGDWKLIRYPQVDVTQLFNLAEDPYETRDLSGEPGHADRVADMLARLKSQQEQWDDALPLVVDDPKPAAIDVETFFPKDGAE